MTNDQLNPKPASPTSSSPPNNNDIYSSRAGMARSLLSHPCMTPKDTLPYAVFFNTTQRNQKRMHRRARTTWYPGADMGASLGSRSRLLMGPLRQQGGGGTFVCETDAENTFGWELWPTPPRRMWTRLGLPVDVPVVSPVITIRTSASGGGCNSVVALLPEGNHAEW